MTRRLALAAPPLLLATAATSPPEERMRAAVAAGPPPDEALPGRHGSHNPRPAQPARGWMSGATKGRARARG